MDRDAFNVLSLCAGGGGLDMALGLAVRNARTVCSVERDSFACEVLASGAENQGMVPPPDWSDIRTFDGRAWRGVVDCIIAGYPCQPHSVAGLRRGAADPRNLWPEVARIIGQVRPAFAFLENVPGVMRFHFEHVRPDLRRMGYRVEEILVAAEDVGATHKRERLFCLAYAGCPERGTGEPGEHWPGGDDARGDQASSGAVKSGEAVAYSRREHEYIQQRIDGAESSPSVNSMADASNSDGWTGDARSENGEGGWRGGPGCDGLPLFPPGPDPEAKAEWVSLLKKDWTVIPRLPKSSLRRLPHGLADYVGELRVLGNGVCPLAGAYAFCALWALAFGTD